MFCKYCGQTASFVIKSGSFCCEISPNKCPANKKKNSDGIVKAHSEGRMRTDQLGTNRGWAKGKNGFSDDRVKSRTKKDEIFCVNSNVKTDRLKKIILQEKLLKHVCLKCQNTGIWCDETLTLELDHVNGDTRDNRLENLRFLCPNCHSQTPTFRNRKRNGGKPNITDEVLLSAIESSPSIHAGLQKLGLAGAANYKRVYSLLIKNVK